MINIFGTTLYLASSKIQTRYGVAVAHTFQDLISKEHSVVLTFGNITKKKSPILARIHSSCVTSETLRAFDSDDVQQLESALLKIKQKGRGILYYFIQEGRGAGFIAKARDRMLVQASNLNSHQAFKAYGLRGDYRSYDRVRDINALLNIQDPLCLLTNNPEKFSSLRELGVKIDKCIPLEISPNAHSASYLQSKKQKGHNLSLTAQKTFNWNPVPVPIKPFKPYALPNASRFIHAATYNIPIKPVNGALFLSKKKWDEISKVLKPFLDTKLTSQIFLKIDLDSSLQRVEVHIDRNAIKKHIQSADKQNIRAKEILRSLLEVPYWFQVHAYWDIASSEEYIVLEYKSQSKKPGKKSTYVRIQSESLFNRFPLEDMEDRDKLKKSIYHIVKNDGGLLVLLHNDGRGAGFGVVAIEKMMRQQRRIKTSVEAYKKLGIPYDIRDYQAAALLIKHHVKDSAASIISSSAHSLSLKPESIACYADAGIKIDKFLFLEDEMEIPKAPGDHFFLKK